MSVASSHNTPEKDRDFATKTESPKGTVAGSCYTRLTTPRDTSVKPAVAPSPASHWTVTEGAGVVVVSWRQPGLGPSEHQAVAASSPLVLDSPESQPPPPPSAASKEPRTPIIPSARATPCVDATPPSLDSEAPCWRPWSPSDACGDGCSRTPIPSSLPLSSPVSDCVAAAVEWNDSAVRFPAADDSAPDFDMKALAQDAAPLSPSASGLPGDALFQLAGHTQSPLPPAPTRAMPESSVEMDCCSEPKLMCPDVSHHPLPTELATKKKKRKRKANRSSPGYVRHKMRRRLHQKLKRKLAKQKARAARQQ